MSCLPIKIQAFKAYKNLKSKPEFQQAVKEAFKESKELQDVIYSSLDTNYVFNKDKIYDLSSEERPSIQDIRNFGDSYKKDGKIVKVFAATNNIKGVLKEGFSGIHTGLGTTKGESKGTIFLTPFLYTALDYGNMYSIEGFDKNDIGIIEIEINNGAGVVEGDEIRLRKEDIVSVKEVSVNKNKGLITNEKKQQALDFYTDYIAKISLGLEVNPMTGEYNDSVVNDVVYHGTLRYFANFKKSQGTWSWRNFGYHFTNNNNVANEYRNGKIVFEFPIREITNRLADKKLSWEDKIEYSKKLWNEVVTDLAINKENSKYFEKRKGYNAITFTPDKINTKDNVATLQDEFFNLFNGAFPEADNLVKHKGFLVDRTFKEDGYKKSVLLNIKNPYISDKIKDGSENDFMAELGEKSHKEKRTDGTIIEQTNSDFINYVVFSPEQILIINGKDAIRGFKEFVNKQTQMNSNLNSEIDFNNKTPQTLDTFQENLSKLKQEDLKCNL